MSRNRYNTRYQKRIQSQGEEEAVNDIDGILDDFEKLLCQNTDSLQQTVDRPKNNEFYNIVFPFKIID